jgi:hypothetical protein
MLESKRQMRTFYFETIKRKVICQLIWGTCDYEKLGAAYQPKVETKSAWGAIADELQKASKESIKGKGGKKKKEKKVEPSPYTNYHEDPIAQNKVLQ